MQDFDIFCTFICQTKNASEKVMADKTKRWKLDTLRKFRNHYLQKKILIHFRFAQLLIDNSFDLNKRTDLFIENVDDIFEVICVLRNNIACLEEIFVHDQVMKRQSQEQHARALISLGALCMHFLNFQSHLARSQVIRMYSHMKLLVEDLRIFKNYQPQLIDETNIAVFDQKMKSLLFQ